MGEMTPSNWRVTLEQRARRSEERKLSVIEVVLLLGVVPIASFEEGLPTFRGMTITTLWLGGALLILGVQDPGLLVRRVTHPLMLPVYGFLLSGALVDLTYGGTGLGIWFRYVQVFAGAVLVAS